VADGKKVVHYTQDGVDYSVAADEIFYALGRVPNVEHLDLEAAGVRYHNDRRHRGRKRHAHLDSRTSSRSAT
jgi:pyruvate/2-oxoglutarate dehydrogenase complex dihydrolipoamide dehydrogenase (E3) component